jgi:hypothetical protein
MANVLNRTTKQYLTSQNTPDFDPVDWIINPDLSAVQGFASQYWNIVGDVVSPMNLAARNAVDDQLFIDQMTNLNSPPDQIYGDGDDGDVIISADTTLSQDLYPSILTINAGFTLFPNGYRIVCRKGLIINGALRCDGSAAVGLTPGNGAPSGTLGGGGAGALGAVGGTPGLAALDLNTHANPGYGGNGGAGGQNGAAILGGLGGVVKTTLQSRVRPRRLDSLLLGGDFDNGVGSLIARFMGGAGGGAGAGAGANTGGGGGGGAGLMVVAAPFIFVGTTGAVSCRGGAGGASSGGNAGGGGGGGGGVIFNVRQAARNRGSVSMGGGAGGAGTGTGANGSNGSNGRVVIFTTTSGS